MIECKDGVSLAQCRRIQDTALSLLESLQSHNVLMECIGPEVSISRRWYQLVNVR